MQIYALQENRLGQLSKCFRTCSLHHRLDLDHYVGAHHQVPHCCRGLQELLLIQTSLHGPQHGLPSLADFANLPN